jgi:hypothetical protein
MYSEFALPSSQQIGLEDTTRADSWDSYNSYSNLADCKAQITTLVARKVKAFKEIREDLSIQSERDGLKGTYTPAPTEKDKRPQNFTYTFFCVRFGVDPRPKDQSMWTLWAESYGTNRQYWNPDESYLTGIDCERGKASAEQRHRELREKLEKKPFNDSGPFYHCFPVGVTPWGNEK